MEIGISRSAVQIRLHGSLQKIRPRVATRHRQTDHTEVLRRAILAGEKPHAAWREEPTSPTKDNCVGARIEKHGWLAIPSQLPGPDYHPKRRLDDRNGQE